MKLPGVSFSSYRPLVTLITCRSKSTTVAAAQKIFDHATKQQQRRQAAINALKESKGVNTFDYLKNEVGWRLADRVFDIKRTFGTGVEICAGRGYVAQHLDNDAVDYLMLVDPVKELLMQRKPSAELDENRQSLTIADDRTLSFLKSDSLDLITSCLSMHWINDLRSSLQDYFRVLRNDGAFIGAMFCSDTLCELRSALQQAEMDLRSSYTARISPFVRPEDVASLLNSTGYTMVTLDCDEFRIGYPSAMELMRDLQGMGEQNCAIARRMNLSRAILKKTCDLYREMYSESDDGSINATFQVVYWIGWKPDPNNVPHVADRGSGTFSLKDLDKLTNEELPLRPIK